MATPVKKLTAADESRGIQNAVSTTSRFARQRQGRTLQAELLAQSAAGQGEAANDAEYDGGWRAAGQRDRTRAEFEEAEIIRQELAELARREGVAYEEGNEELLVKNPPEKPPFPGVMLSIALLKDLFDAAQLTGIGILLTTALSFLIGLILFLWILSRMGAGWWGKKMRGVWTRYALAVAIELVPFLGFLPASTILVLSVHFRETKLALSLRGTLARIQRGAPRP